MKKVTKRERKANAPRNAFVRNILASPNSVTTTSRDGSQYVGAKHGTKIRIK